MLDIIRKEPWFFIDYKVLKQQGMLDAQEQYLSFDKYIPEEFPSNQLYITTFDLIQGESIYHNSGDLRTVLKAACALSTFFKPMEYEGKTIVDAGLSNNFPVEPLIGQCDVLLGSYVMPKLAPQDLQLENTQHLMNRLMTINSYNNAHAKFDHCDMVFDHNYLKDYKILDAHKLDEIYEQSLMFCDAQFKQYLNQTPSSGNKMPF
ncbi:patatin-like phospholipase family protein [Lacinutrix neustonica]|uniref:Patatin-like phospholipase family protein n=1 Tax=Lacinutrix neustonica TaxID=2980107 RepID=A0A9E8MX54_9FLAO|nr:patatin-like phospholipase family protein [Lacinutrix neustonica]WAC02514.1 patatin-like phospholipase family protein [Lacinutrix neustonica]